MNSVYDNGAVVGEAWVRGVMDTLGNDGAFLRRIRHQMDEARLYTRAKRSLRHADWFCSLPWYRQWWALVTGRW